MTFWGTILYEDNKKYIVNKSQIKDIEIVNPITGEFIIFSMKTKTTFKEIVKQPYQMKNYELQQHFNKLDINTMNPARYAVTRNLMIERGLLVGELANPSDMYEAVEVF